MKKIYQQLTLLLFVLGSVTIQAQFLNPDKPTNQNEFLIGGGNAIIAGPGDGCRNCSSEIRDFNFAFSNSFNAALANELLIQQAARRAAHDWYEKQKEVIRKHLNNFFDHSGDYEQAKNRLFAESEKRAIDINRFDIQNEYNRLNSNVSRGKNQDLKGLRALKQRELEIRNGNISNSLYADVKVNGIPLKNINNLSSITRERNKILLTNNLDRKLWGSHQYSFLAKSMDRNNPFQEELLRETNRVKNQYYGSYNYWDRLNYIQLLVHTEKILKSRGFPGIVFSNQELQIFGKFDGKTVVATRAYIENFLQQEYLDNMYVMHPDYWKVLLDKHFGGLLLNQNAAKNLHRKLIKEERDRLVKNTPLGANSSVDYLVNELGITNKDEFNWLNANPNRAKFYETIIEDQKRNVAIGEYGNTLLGDDIIIVGGTEGPFGNARELASTEIKNGGLVQAMIEELGITDNSQKRYLYNFSKEANRLRELADKNRVNEIISSNGKLIIKEIIKLFTNNENREGVTFLSPNRYLSTPKVNPKEETKCFDITKPAKMIIYAEQSIQNSREISARIGHAFVGIQQGNIVRNLGFYPDSPMASVLGNQNSEIHDNSRSPFHVSISVDISSNQLSSIINIINNFPKTYELNDYNCTDFAIQIANAGGLDLPKTIGKYSVFFKGRNPSDLGEDIRAMPDNNNMTINRSGGLAPARSGECD